MTFTVTPIGGGEGIQVVVYEANGSCTNFTQISNCESPGTPVPMTVTATGMIPGNPYVIMTDGFGGATHEYTFGTPPPPVPTGTDTVAVCADDTLFFAGEPLVQPGNYQFTFPDGAADGSDSLFILTLENLPLGTSDTTLLLPCPDTCAAWVDTVFCGTGLHTYVLPGQSVNGCDSLVQVTLLPDPTVITTDLGEFFICSDECFSFAGVDYCTFGDYEVPLVSSEGCDSLVQFRVSLVADQVGSLTEFVCGTDGYVYGDSTYAVPGNHQIVLPDAASNGCDSILFLNLLPTGPTFVNDTILLCSGECVIIDDIVVCEPGIFAIEPPSACDTNVLMYVLFSTVQSEITAPQGVFLNSTYAKLLLDGTGSSNALTYEWRRNNGPVFSTNPMLMVHQHGRYHLRVTDVDGCESESSVRVYQGIADDDGGDASTNLDDPVVHDRSMAGDGDDVFGKGEMTLLPNPSAGTFRILPPAGWLPTRLRIFDARGSVHYAGAFRKEWDRALVPGLYFVEIGDAQRRAVARLVVTR